MPHISMPQFDYLGYGASDVIDLPSCNLSTAKRMASMRCTRVRDEMISLVVGRSSSLLFENEQSVENPASLNISTDTHPKPSRLLPWSGGRHWPPRARDSFSYPITFNTLSRTSSYTQGMLEAQHIQCSFTRPIIKTALLCFAAVVPSSQLSDHGSDIFETQCNYDQWDRYCETYSKHVFGHVSKWNICTPIDSWKFTNVDSKKCSNETQWQRKQLSQW